MLCLTTDSGLALDIYANHMINVGRLTDDDWADSEAFIEEFTEFPSDRADIMDFISDQEKSLWKSGETIVF